MVLLRLTWSGMDFNLNHSSSRCTEGSFPRIVSSLSGRLPLRSFKRISTFTDKEKNNSSIDFEIGNFRKELKNISVDRIWIDLLRIIFSEKYFLIIAEKNLFNELWSLNEYWKFRGIEKPFYSRNLK